MVNIKGTGGQPQDFSGITDDESKGSFEIYRKRMEKKGFVDRIDEKEQKEGINITTGYVQPAKSPKLAPVVVVKKQELSQKQPTHKETHKETADFRSSSIDRAANHSPELENLFLGEFNKALSKFILPNGQHLTSAQKEVIKLLQRFPQAMIDSGVLDRELAHTVLSQVEHQALAQLRLSNPSKVPVDYAAPRGDENGETFQAIALQIFDEMLEKTASERELSSETTGKLRFAFYHPELADKESLDLLNKLGIKQFTTSFFSQNGIAMPYGWKPSTERFDHAAQGDYVAKLFSQIDQAFSPERLSKFPKLKAFIDQKTKDMKPFEKGEFINQLIQYAKTLAVHPDAETPVKELLEELLKQLKAEALKETFEKFSLSESMPKDSFKPDAEFYDATIKSHFGLLAERISDKMVQEMKPPLSKEELKMLKELLQNQETTAPPHVKALAEAIKAEALKQVREIYGVQIQAVVNAPAVWEGMPVLKNGINYLKDSLDIAKKYLPKIKNAGDRTQVLMYMKTVGDAINQLQELICAMENQDASKTKTLSQAQLETVQAKIKKNQELLAEQRKQEMEARDKQESADKCSGVMKVLTPIIVAVSVIATIASFGSLGPVALTISIALLGLSLTDQIAGAAGASWSATQYVCYGIGYTVAYAITGGTPSFETCALIGSIILCVACLGACARAAFKAVIDSGARAAGVIARFTAFSVRYGGTINITGQIINQSNMAGNITKVFHLSPEASRNLQYTLMGLTVATSVGTSVASALRPKSEILGMLQQRLLQLEESIRKATTNPALRLLYNIEKIFIKNSIRMHEKAINFEKFSHGLSATLNTTSGVITSRADLLRAAADDILGAVEMIKAHVQEWELTQQDIIETLRDAVKRLMEILESLSGWSASLSELQMKKFENVQRAEFTV